MGATVKQMSQDIVWEWLLEWASVACGRLILIWSMWHCQVASANTHTDTGQTQMCSLDIKWCKLGTHYRYCVCPVYRTWCQVSTSVHTQILDRCAHLTSSDVNWTHITATVCIRINYPLNTFNYHLSGINIANFNKIHHTVSEQQLFTKWNLKTEFSNMENTD